MAAKKNKIEYCMNSKNHFLHLKKPGISVSLSEDPDWKKIVRIDEEFISINEEHFLTKDDARILSKALDLFVNDEFKKGALIDLEVLKNGDK